MAAIYRFIVNATSSAMSTLQQNNDSANVGDEGQSHPEFDTPNVADVLLVKKMLVLGANLPLEIADLIIDYAEYWPHTSVVTNKSYLAIGAHANRPQDRGDVFIVRISVSRENCSITNSSFRFDHYLSDMFMIQRTR